MKLNGEVILAQDSAQGNEDLPAPLTVSVSVDSNLLTTALADISRPDVASAPGDNGLHGFTIPTPAALRTDCRIQRALCHNKHQRSYKQSAVDHLHVSTPPDGVGTQVILKVDPFKFDSGAPATRQRLVGLNFSVREVIGAELSFRQDSRH